MHLPRHAEKGEIRVVEGGGIGKWEAGGRIKQVW